MKSQLKLSDTPEADEFFRRGDEQLHVADSLQPTSFEDSDVLADPRLFRTPAQRKRRATLIKLVSLIMAFLTVGAAGAFLGTLRKHAAPELPWEEARLEIAPSVAPTTISSVDSVGSIASGATSAGDQLAADPVPLMTPSTANAAEQTPIQVTASAPSELSKDVVGTDSHAQAPSTESGQADSRVGAQKPAAQSVAVADGSAGVRAASSALLTSQSGSAAAPEKRSVSSAPVSENKAGAATKPVKRLRAWSVRRQAPQAPQARAPKSEARAPESSSPLGPAPSVKAGGEYRPPTATFADE